MMGKVRKRNEPASNPQWRTGNRKVIEGCRRSIKQNGGGKIMRIQSILLATAGLASLTLAQAVRAKTAQSSAGQETSMAVTAQSMDESAYTVSRAKGFQLVFTERDVRGIKALPLYGGLRAREMT